MERPKKYFKTTSKPGFYREGAGGYFSLYATHATGAILGLFIPGKETPEWEFEMVRRGDLWHIGIEHVPEGMLYAFRCEGPYDPSKGLLFRPDVWLSDPYAKIIDTAATWGQKKEKGFPHAAEPPAFDWEGVSPPKIAKEELVIYEMHVRGFTKHTSSDVKSPGTFLGVIEKIPYLKKLGINAVELMPIFEFDEIHCKDIQPTTGEPLLNYWGYNSLFFFIPMRRYAASQEKNAPLNECKTMIRELHRHGIEVILDVVYNHTGEGKEKDYYVHFRGVDNSIYYLVDEEGEYKDFTGCGNTVNTNHPIVQEWILDSLKYWIEEFHIDGFRFDLASIFTRDLKGHPMISPPIVQAISQLNGVKLFAESWDAAGLYQVGLFPTFGPWSDWNGKYRDTMRRFIKGTDGYAGLFADALSGSESIFKASKKPQSSLNFITVHDGYTLRDLVTYQMKHNYENGEMNRDGNNQNDSWNCGTEGPTSDPFIANLRERQMRNFLLALFLSQGIPILLMGDEYGHSRKGNNNPYVQDNDLNWFRWDLLEKNQKIFSFTSQLIALRKQYPHFKKTHFLSPEEIDWHGPTPFHPNWNSASRFLAYTLKGTPSFYVAFNANFSPISIEIPPSLTPWREIVFTDRDWDAQSFSFEGPSIASPFQMPAYSALLAKN